MTWHRVDGADYLQRSYYDAGGRRRQKAEGRRDVETEAAKDAWEDGRRRARERLSDLEVALTRQAAINRAIGLGRMPLLGARILRALTEVGWLGRGLRVVGTNALYAYEAASGVLFDPAVTTTEDIDLLFDSRRTLRVAVSEQGIGADDLLTVLRRVDRSFERSRQAFRAVNRDGYLVDLVKPERDPPWRFDRERIGSGDDLTAVSIAGLSWLESAPVFEAVVIDDRGGPLRVAAPDPRVFAAHKLWLSRRPDREPVRRTRDAAQASAVAELVARYLVHLPWEKNELRMLPRAVFDLGAPLFEAAGAEG